METGQHECGLSATGPKASHHMFASWTRPGGRHQHRGAIGVAWEGRARLNGDSPL
jgi:hypothetical protein